MPCVYPRCSHVKLSRCPKVPRSQRCWPVLFGMSQQHVMPGFARTPLTPRSWLWWRRLETENPSHRSSVQRVDTLDTLENEKNGHQGVPDRVVIQSTFPCAPKPGAIQGPGPWSLTAALACDRRAATTRPFFPNGTAHHVVSPRDMSHSAPTGAGADRGGGGWAGHPAEGAEGGVGGQGAGGQGRERGSQG